MVRHTVVLPMYFKYSLKLLCSLLVLFFHTLLFSAEEQRPDYTEMSLQQLMSLEIFTAASLLPTELKKAPGTVYSFNRDDFSRLGVRRLNELLEYVPGFQLNQYRKRHRSVWARGMINRYNNKMKLLIDNVPIQHVYYGNFSAGENLALEKIAKVEVIIGPASSLYGANAFAGVIAVTTRDFTEADSTGAKSTASVETGMELGNHSRAKASVFYNSEKLQGFISYLDQDAPFDKARKSFIGQNASQPLDEEYKNIYLKARPFKGLQLSFDYQYNETPFVFFPDNAPVYTQDTTEEKFYNVSARYEYGDIVSGKLETTAYYIDDQTTEEMTMQATGEQAYQENRDSIYYGIKTTWLKQVFIAHKIAIGAEWQHDEAKDMDYVLNWHYSDGYLSPADTGSLLFNDDEENNDFAFFVQDVWEINSLVTATIGARYDKFEQFDNDANYRLALVYTPTAQQTIKMLWGTSVRKPTYREYLKVPELNAMARASGTAALPMPQSETMETIEFAYAYQWLDANVSVTTFYNEFEDYLHEVSIPGGSDEYFVNSDNTWRMHGVEMLSEYRFTKQLNFRATLGWLRAREAGSGDIPYLAEWTGSLLSDYQWYQAHHVVFSVFYNDDRQDTNDQLFPDDEAESFTTLNVHAYGKLFNNVAYQFGVRNLTDEVIYDTAADFNGRYNTRRTERELWGKLTYTYRF